ncbi:MAG: hypothetical protein Q9Q40_11550 [Acidobacteriota bacterium]|nr:hypothetical protein [Acidobacteriota bacterium]MDQ7087566.1 hypothetical protein [Acidobacteriota bacterium]
MLEVNPLNSLPQHKGVAQPTSAEVEKKKEKQTRARSRVGQPPDTRKPHAPSSDGHAGPGGRPGSHLDVKG